jgi:hypothetical protein
MLLWIMNASEALPQTHAEGGMRYRFPALS